MSVRFGQLGRSFDLIHKSKCVRGNMFDAIIFDFDGVLVDSEIISLSELNRSFESIGISLPWDVLVNDFLGKSNRSHLQFVEECTGQKPAPDFLDVWANRVYERFSSDLVVMPGTLALLDWLDEAGIPYCIASGSGMERIGLSLSLTGLEPYFETGVFDADCVMRGKPEPDIFLHAMDKMRVRPEHCLVVEDGLAGTIGARRAGIPDVFGFVGGNHLKGCEALHGEKLLKNGANRLIQSHEALLALLKTM